MRKSGHINFTGWAVTFVMGMVLGCGQSTQAPFPPAATLRLPQDGSNHVLQTDTLTWALSPDFTWGKAMGSEVYQIQVANNSAFLNDTSIHDMVYNDTLISPLLPVAVFADTSDTVSYYWRVKVKNADGTSSWSQVWSFLTAIPRPTLVSPLDTTIALFNNPAGTDTILVTWHAVKNATGYTIQISHDSSCTAANSFVNGPWPDTVYPLTVAPGTNYYWRVTAQGFYGKSVLTPVAAIIDSPATAPAIATPPSSATVVVGDSVTFMVAAAAHPAPTYQWQNSPDGITWTAIPGATGASYTIDTVKATDAGRYNVVVSNSYGSATSAAAVLTVTP